MARFEPHLGNPSYAEPDDFDRYDDYERDRFGGEHRGLLDRVLSAPTRLAIVTVSFGALAIVGVNAAYLQPGAHPAPMLTTRDAPRVAPLSNIVDDRVNIGQTDQGRSIPPSPVLPGPHETAFVAPAQSDGISSLIEGPRFVAPTPMPRASVLSGTQTLVPPASVAAQPSSVNSPRSVETIEVNDPIGALLAPVVTQVDVQTSPPQQDTAQGGQPVVLAVQSVLAEMGYAPGSIDGVMGPSTEEAIRRFQLSRALSPDGRISDTLLREIERVTGARLRTS
ncbi:MAG: peptidoglycan-binding protein [Pseudomonadota bacterium]